MVTTESEVSKDHGGGIHHAGEVCMPQGKGSMDTLLEKTCSGDNAPSCISTIKPGLHEKTTQTDRQAEALLAAQ